MGGEGHWGRPPKDEACGKGLEARAADKIVQQGVGVVTAAHERGVPQRYNWTRRPAGVNKPNLRVFSFSDAFRLPINVCD